MSEAAVPATAARPKTFTAKAFAAQGATTPLTPFTLQRREPRPQDVQIEILFCGVCHSDLHQARNEWDNAMPTIYPCVPGHEIIGGVVKVGSAVKNFKEGDFAAVGCVVDSCRHCAACLDDDQVFCENGVTLTYNFPDQVLGGITYGGYSDSIVVDENFALKISPKVDLAGTAPLLCAGITTYNPLRYANVGKGQKVGIVGLGGLGHMAVKFAHAFGAHVVLFTTSPNKVADAKRLGADEVVVSKNADEVQKHANSFDYILDCVSAEHDVNALLGLLKRNGTLNLVGAPEKPLAVAAFNLLFGRHRLTGSAIGGIKQTQEMLDFCAEHNITADIEKISIQQINQAYDRLLKNDVKYRFVIDMATLQ
jgi:alcohol dehydrogenase (NADP+)